MTIRTARLPRAGNLLVQAREDLSGLPDWASCYQFKQKIFYWQYHISVQALDFESLWEFLFCRKFIYLPYRASGKKVIVIPLRCSLLSSRLTALLSHVILNGMPSQPVSTIQPCHVTSCKATYVACHLHLWRIYWDLLCVTAVRQGWKEY